MLRQIPSLFAMLVLSSLCCAQRPTMAVSGHFGSSAPGERVAYLARPDRVTVTLSAGAARKGKVGFLLFSTRLLPKPIPFGPDLIDIDPAGYFFALFGTHDAQGVWRTQFPVPSAWPAGASFAMQGVVWASGETHPFRFSRGKELRILDGRANDYYVDGDATKAGNGNPYTPFQSMTAATAAAKKSGGGTIRIQNASKVYPRTIQVPTKTTLIGENWTGTRPGLPSLEGTVQVFGTASQRTSGVRLAKLRILMQRTSTKNLTVGLRARQSDGLIVEDCVIEGTSSGGTTWLAGIALGNVQCVIRRCTIRKLNVGAKPADATHAAEAIIIGDNVQATIHSCWIHSLLDRPQTSVSQVSAVCIKFSGTSGGSVTMANNLFGPIRIPKPVGSNPRINIAEIYGIYQMRGQSVRNNVFYGFDLSAFASNQQQIKGVFTYGAKTEVTNNVFLDFRNGQTNWIVNTAMEGPGLASHCCVWGVTRAFDKGFKAGAGILLKDPRLVAPSFLPRKDSPCLNAGNPLYPPKHIGLSGGTYPGAAGAR